QVGDLKHACARFQVLRDEARLGVLGVEVIDDGHRLPELKAVVDQQGHAGPRVLGDIARLFVLGHADIDRVKVKVELLEPQDNAHPVRGGAVEETVQVHAYTTLTDSVPRPSTEPTMWSPATTAPTPSGVPV